MKTKEQIENFLKQKIYTYTVLKEFEIVELFENALDGLYSFPLEQYPDVLKRDINDITIDYTEQEKILMIELRDYILS